MSFVTATSSFHKHLTARTQNGSQSDTAKSAPQFTARESKITYKGESCPVIYVTHKILRILTQHNRALHTLEVEKALRSLGFMVGGGEEGRRRSGRGHLHQQGAVRVAAKGQADRVRRGAQAAALPEPLRVGDQRRRAGRVREQALGDQGDARERGADEHEPQDGGVAGRRAEAPARARGAVHGLPHESATKCNECIANVSDILLFPLGKEGYEQDRYKLDQDIKALWDSVQLPPIDQLLKDYNVSQVEHTYVAPSNSRRRRGEGKQAKNAGLQVALLLRWAGRPAGVEQRAHALRVDLVQHGGQNAPRLRHLVDGGEVAALAAERVVEQNLVAPDDGALREVVVDVAQNALLHLQTHVVRLVVAGEHQVLALGLHVELARADAPEDGGVGLDAEDQVASLELGAKVRGEGALHVETHLAQPLVEALAGGDHEGHALPLVVVDVEHHGAEGGADGVGRDALLLHVGALAAVLAGGVLADDGVLHAHGAHGAQHLVLLLGDGVVEPVGLVHGDEREELHGVVLHHVADDAVVLEVAAPEAADALLHLDVHALDVAPAEEVVVAQGPLYGYYTGNERLPQVVVDEEHLLGLGVLPHDALDLLAALRVAAEGLLQHDAEPPLLGAADGGGHLHDGVVGLGGGREVNEAVSDGGAALDFVELVVELEQGRRLVVPNSDAVEAFLELRDHGGEVEPRSSLAHENGGVYGRENVLRDGVEEVVERLVRAAHGQNTELVGKKPKVKQVEESRVEFPAREVASAAEENEGQAVRGFQRYLAPDAADAGSVQHGDAAGFREYLSGRETNGVDVTVLQHRGPDALLALALEEKDLAPRAAQKGQRKSQSFVHDGGVGESDHDALLAVSHLGPLEGRQVLGEEPGDVEVVADAQGDEVGLRRVLVLGHADDEAVGARGQVGVGEDDVLLGDRPTLQQRVADQALVGQLVGGRHVALVHQEDDDAVEVNADVRQAAHVVEHGARSAAAREPDRHHGGRRLGLLRLYAVEDQVHGGHGEALLGVALEQAGLHDVVQVVHVLHPTGARREHVRRIAELNDFVELVRVKGLQPLLVVVSVGRGEAGERVGRGGARELGRALFEVVLRRIPGTLGAARARHARIRVHHAGTGTVRWSGSGLCGGSKLQCPAHTRLCAASFGRGSA
ncbi:uncharacterized protein BcabD6B2_46140 [Babesia caballi]|uniref:Uncharacterized protein n=1 Tax=Babesia caballi TaxID=5871 RepID=A0AAV4LZI7_BABCB|nr:hypothetical protein, conserved [Babesia caballi]